jgi:hypothetical protein
MHVRNLELEDYFNLPNALADGKTALSGPPGSGLGENDATVSFDFVWSGPVTRRVNFKDAANGFAGEYVENQATVTWSGLNEDTGFTFTANPGKFSTSVPEAGPFAELGHERNGVFFPLGPLTASIPPQPGQQPPGSANGSDPGVAAVLGNTLPVLAQMTPVSGDTNSSITAPIVVQPAATLVTGSQNSATTLLPALRSQALATGVSDQVFAQNLDQGLFSDPLALSGG